MDYFAIGTAGASVVFIEGYMRRNDEKNIYRPTNTLNIISNKLGDIFYTIGNKLANLLDIFKWIRDLKKYLPFKDILNIFSAVWELILKPVYEFIRGFYRYYMPYSRSADAKPPQPPPSRFVPPPPLTYTKKYVNNDLGYHEHSDSVNTKFIEEMINRGIEDKLE